MLVVQSYDIKISKLSPIKKRYNSTEFVITVDRIWSTTILIYKRT